MEWMSAFLTVGVIVGVFGILNFILLIEHPSRIGIFVENEVDTLDERLKIEFSKGIRHGYLRGKSIQSNDEIYEKLDSYPFKQGTNFNFNALFYFLNND